MIKRGFIILIVVFFTLFLSAVFGKVPNGFLVSSVKDSVSVNKNSIKISGKEIVVEIADDDKERNQGLSGRKSLGKNEGMLFIFPLSAKYSFWMKDMNFALDIIWIDENKQVSAVSKNIVPETYPASFSPSDTVKYVLEVNAGWAEKNNIKEGDFIEL